MLKKFIKKTVLVFAIIMFLMPIFNVEAYVSVKGYYRKDGTYVRPHVRSNPNGVKYDNYSYTPSQGLYNKTYGTKGAEWDTPTWTTDPDYYEGKALYNMGQAGTTNSVRSKIMSDANYPIYNYNVPEPPSAKVQQYIKKGRNLCKEQLLRISYRVYLKRAPTDNEIAYHVMNYYDNTNLLNHIKNSVGSQNKKMRREKECNDYISCFKIYGGHSLCYDY
jgi:hypothetical protein